MITMKPSIKLLLLLSLTIWGMMTAQDVNAQRIQVVDTSGKGIPLASILTEDGLMAGTTNLDGFFDMKGADRVVVTHVAYKPLEVTASVIRDGRVTMEEQNYGLSEITVTPRKYLYVEAYYRVYVYRNDSLCYFLSGIMPNAFDLQNNKREHGSYYHSYCEYSYKKGAAITWAVRAQEFNAGQMFGRGQLDDGKLKKKYFLTITDKGPGHRVYSNPYGVVGNLISTGGQSRMTLDGGKAQMYANEARGETRVLARRRRLGYQYQYTLIYADRTYDPSNFVMEADHWEYNDKKSHVKFIIETYAVDHSYMNKDEWKARKNELRESYKSMVSLDKLETYERKHNIPALSAAVRQAILRLRHW